MADDLISRQALMKEFADFVKRSNNSDFVPTPTWNDAVSLVGSMPSADAVEVVRCRECKYWEYDAIFYDGWCRGKHQGNPDWFCADGERREDDND